MIWANVGCGPFRAPAPWVNLDYHEGDGVHPDIIVTDASRPLGAYDDGTVERAYLGHVLEHVPWPEVPAFLADIERALAPGGHLMVVGPDVLRIIQRWHEGLEPEGWLLVESCMENPWDRCYGRDEDLPYGIVERETQWKYARHWWNCYETRVLYALRTYTGLGEVTAHPIKREALGEWPVVAYTQWQCAVSATRP